MGFFNETEEERKYRELIRALRSSDVNYEIVDLLVNYLVEVRDGRRNNEFYDFDFLQRIVIELASNNFESVEEFKEVFNSVLNRVRFLLPDGDKTEGYESIKNEIINYHCSIERNKLFSEELYSLFDNRLDYLQIMDIVLGDTNLIENFDSIVKFACELGKEVDDQGLLKREVISYLHLYGSILSEDEAYLEKRINEARMRYGVYPGINEKTIASISREVEKARGILKKLEVLEKKVDSYVEKVDAKTKLGIQTLNDTIVTGKKEIETYASDAVKRMQEDLAVSKQELLEELKKYLTSLEDTMKSNSDQVFNQMLIDAREKLEQIRVVASSLSGTTTRELLRIQQETQTSLDTLKRYVETNPDLKSSLKVAEDSEEVMKALLQFSAQQTELNGAQAGIVIPGKEVVVPETVVVEKEDFLVPQFTMTEGIIDVFNRRIPFKDRMRRIEERIRFLEGQGYIIPDALREALPWYLMGKKIVYFYGPTQSGKTTIADLLVKVVETELLDGGKITEEHSITSYNDVRGVFDENALFYALYYGKTIFYDELDNGNPDNLIVLGTFSSKLVNKIDSPEKEITVQFAKRRFVPINANARIIAAGNTSGKGRNREYTARSRMDESSLERMVPIYVGYNNDVEKKIFGKYNDWFDFFNYFREQCNAWALNSGMDSSEGNVTTGDASTIVECIKENSMNIGMIMRGIFIQTKEPDYLAFLVKSIKGKYNIEDISEEEYQNINDTLLEELDIQAITKVFVYEANKVLNSNKALAKKRK